MFESPHDFVRYLERTQGELNIYEHELKPRPSDAELSERIYKATPELFVQMYGSPEEAKRELRNSIHASDMVRMFYRPFTLTWALGKAPHVMGAQWPEVSDILVAPVTIPVFNAAAVRSPDGFDVIIFNARLFMTLAEATQLLWDAHRDWAHTAWDNLYVLREHLEGHIDAMLRPSDKPALPQPTYRTTDLADFRLAAASSQIQVLFVLLHEFAHVTCGHLGSEQLNRSHPLDRSLAHGKYYTQSQEEEFEADETAAEWLFGADPSQIFDEEIRVDAENYAFLGLAVVNLCTILAALESRLKGASDTHPPAFDRAAAIVATAAQIPRHETTAERMTEVVEFFRSFVGLRRQ